MKHVHWFFIVCWTLTPTLGLRAAQDSGSVETTVKTVTLDPESKVPVVILETVGDKKLLPIWIDLPEARAIALEIERIAPPRPLTHDLIRNLLSKLGVKLQRVTITDLRNNTYFALLTLERSGQSLEIDSRPSDAIAVALRMKAPIYVTMQVLAKAKPLLAPSGGGAAARQKLGLQTQDLTAELAALLDLSSQRGVLVADVAPGSPASNTGLQRGDILIKANDKALQSTADLDAVLEVNKAPAQIRLEVLRKGKPIVIMIDSPS
ncbi:MAG: bifunctional nuclease family protein [Deltaproteobacteria bacterium]|nr:bifunctional nuclease family protein [Deltaproteobacteria bacterium]